MYEQYQGGLFTSRVEICSSHSCAFGYLFSELLLHILHVDSTDGLLVQKYKLPQTTILGQLCNDVMNELDLLPNYKGIPLLTIWCTS